MLDHTYAWLVIEHREPAYEPKHDTEASYVEHGTETDYVGHEPIGFDRDVKQTGKHTPHPHFPTPTPTPCTHDTPRLNQTGHMTMSKTHTSPLILPSALSYSKNVWSGYVVF